MVKVDGTFYVLAPGAVLDLVALGHLGVTKIELTGIDPSLMLDFTYSLAFPLGLVLGDPDGGGATVSMTPLVVDLPSEPTTVVPLPASGLLLAGVLGGLGGVARRLKVSRKCRDS